jgi:chorismate synthase
MSGNTFGTLFAVTNFGESHGPAIGCVIDGCPPGMPLSEADIQADLDRRRPGTSRHVTQRNEPDAVEILSGVYEGKTTGTPIALLIRNTDQRSKDYGNIAADLSPRPCRLHLLAQIRHSRPARRRPLVRAPDAPTVAAGAVAKKWLAQQYGTSFAPA